MRFSLLSPVKVVRTIFASVLSASKDYAWYLVGQEAIPFMAQVNCRSPTLHCIRKARAASDLASKKREERYWNRVEAAAKKKREEVDAARLAAEEAKARQAEYEKKQEELLNLVKLLLNRVERLEEKPYIINNNLTNNFFFGDNYLSNASPLQDLPIIEGIGLPPRRIEDDVPDSVIIGFLVTVTILIALSCWFCCCRNLRTHSTRSKSPSPPQTPLQKKVTPAEDTSAVQDTDTKKPAKKVVDSFHANENPQNVAPQVTNSNNSENSEIDEKVLDPMTLEEISSLRASLRNLAHPPPSSLSTSPGVPSTSFSFIGPNPATPTGPTFGTMPWATSGPTFGPTLNTTPGPTPDPTPVVTPDDAPDDAPATPTPTPAVALAPATTPAGASASATTPAVASVPDSTPGATSDSTTITPAPRRRARIRERTNPLVPTVRGRPVYTPIRERID